MSAELHRLYEEERERCMAALNDFFDRCEANVASPA